MASVQWDRWQFMLSTPKLCKQDVAVISHSHRDHWATNLTEKDTIFLPASVVIPKGFQSLRNVYRVEYSTHMEKLRLTALNQDRLEALLRPAVPKPHAFWWLVSTGPQQRRARVLFIGDVAMNDVSTARAMIAEMFRRDLPIHGVLLPSFGGVLAHEAKHAMDLATSIERFAYECRDIHDITVAALPHPIDASWADYNAAPVPLPP